MPCQVVKFVYTEVHDIHLFHQVVVFETPLQTWLKNFVQAQLMLQYLSLSSFAVQIRYSHGLRGLSISVWSFPISPI